MATKLFYCSFCGKNNNEVQKIIAGPRVYICNECVSLCQDIINEEDETLSLEKKNPLAAKILQLITSNLASFLTEPIAISDELLAKQFNTDEKQINKAIAFLKKNNMIIVIPIVEGLKGYMTYDKSIDVIQTRIDKIKKVRVDVLLHKSTKIKF